MSTRGAVLLVLLGLCTGLRSVVVIDNVDTLNTHSQFLSDLEAVSSQVDTKSVSNSNLRLSHLQERLYDLVVLLCTSDSAGLYLSKQTILDYYDQGGNLIVAADQDVSRLYRSLFLEMGLSLSETASSLGGLLLDHHSHHADDHTLLRLPGGLLFRGLGMTSSIYQNHQQTTLLSPGPYSYSSAPGAPSGLVLLSAVQGINNARAVLSSGMALFSNALYVQSQGANREYVKQHVLSYAAQQSNVLRVASSRHYLSSDPSKQQPWEYKIKDQVTYEVQVQQWDQSSGSWVAYVASDLQVEFVMLDPYVRMALSPIGTPFLGWYQASFQAPDQHGVFHFKVNYLRPTFTFLSHKDKVPVRPFRHNEYARFLLCACPYYLGVFLPMGGFLVMLWGLLYSREEAAKKDQ